MMEKALRRQQAKIILDSLPADSWNKGSVSASRLLRQLDIHRFDAVLLYKRLRGEFNEKPFQKLAMEHGMALYYPRTAGQDMDFFKDNGSPWTRDSSRILAPPRENPNWSGGNSLLLAPALAADFRGFRLGHGGGYYDRFLATSPVKDLTTILLVPDQTLWTEPLPNDPWDVPFHWILTPTRLFPVESKPAS